MLKVFGSDLKKLRESKGISIAEISAETRINTKFLNMLEMGVFDFQPDTYIRSFLKEYANAIGEEEKRILNDYDKAKAGFYAPRKFETGEKTKVPADVNVKPTPPVTKTAKSTEPVYYKSLSKDLPDYSKPKPPVPEKRFAYRSITQKILIGMLIIAIAAGVYFLIDYLNNSGDKKSDVKPKSFKEMSGDYETRLSRHQDSLKALDSLKKLSADSLHLVIKALKDIRVIVSIDQDSKKFDEELSAKDSLVIAASKEFRFSTTNGLNTEIYLNGRYLKKPFSTRGNSIKDMLITKEGIQHQKDSEQ